MAHTLLGFHIGGGPQLGERPSYTDYGGEGMTSYDYGRWENEMADWKEKKNQQAQRQAIFQEMAQTVGPTPKAFVGGGGTRTAEEGLPAAGVGAMDEMALYGRPKKWPYISSIVNLRTA